MPHSGRWSVEVAFLWSLAVWEVAPWNGRSYSPILQVFIEHLLCTRHCSRPWNIEVNRHLPLGSKYSCWGTDLKQLTK